MTELFPVGADLHFAIIGANIDRYRIVRAEELPETGGNAHIWIAAVLPDGTVSQTKMRDSRRQLLDLFERGRVAVSYPCPDFATLVWIAGLKQYGIMPEQIGETLENYARMTVYDPSYVRGESFADRREYPPIPESWGFIGATWGRW